MIRLPRRAVTALTALVVGIGASAPLATTETTTVVIEGDFSLPGELGVTDKAPVYEIALYRAARGEPVGAPVAHAEIGDLKQTAWRNDTARYRFPAVPEGTYLVRFFEVVRDVRYGRGRVVVKASRGDSFVDWVTLSAGEPITGRVLDAALRRTGLTVVAEEVACTGEQPTFGTSNIDATYNDDETFVLPTMRGRCYALRVGNSNWSMQRVSGLTRVKAGTKGVKVHPLLVSELSVLTVRAGSRTATVRIDAPRAPSGMTQPVAASGKVEIWKGSTRIGSGTARGGSAQVTLNRTLATGDHQVYLRYVGNGLFLESATAATLKVR